MKAIKITILLLFLTGTIYAQNCCESGGCYIRLDDISGVDTDEYQNSLKAAACELVQAFPEDFRRDFRVYDFGFYLHNENFDGSYPEVFEQVKSQIDKPYYLLFGKQTDSTGVYSKIWVEVKLPETGRLSCMTQTQRKLLKTVIYTKVNDENLTKNPYVYWSKEIDAMKYMEKRIIKEVDCCANEYRESCSACLDDAQLDFLLMNNGFFNRTVSVVSEDFNVPPGHLNIHGQLKYKLKIGDDVFIPFNKMLEYDSIMNSYGLSFEGFITDKFSTCSEEFDDIDSMYTNSSADVKIWWNLSLDNGFLWEKADVWKFSKIIGQDFINSCDISSEEFSLRCHGTLRFKRPIELIMGTNDITTSSEGKVAHFIIQSFYKVLMGPKNQKIELEYAIPESSSNILYNYGYADIVNLTLKEIFEIKTVRSWKSGLQQVEKYILKANEFCDPIKKRFHKGISYPPRQELPWPDPTVRFTTFLHKQAKGGVISYELDHNNEKQPQPTLTVIPESKWKIVEDLIEDVQNAPNKIAKKQVVTDFCISKPDDIYYVAIALVLIIGGSAILTIGSEGTASPATIPVILISGFILTVIYNYDDNFY